MRKVSIIYCMMICSLLTLFACSKNKDVVQPTPPPITDTSGGNTDTSSGNTDTSGSTELEPGDSLILVGDTMNNDQSALLYSGNKGVSQLHYPAFAAFGKGFSTTSDRTRSIMKFRIKHLDDSARNNPPQVKKALLYLYQYSAPDGTDPYSVQQDSSNRIELHRIIGYWQDTAITWHTQPQLASGSANPLEDVVTIPNIATPLAAGTNDDQVVDVTAMMQKVFTSKSNKGFLLKLTKESGKSGRSFGSIACPDASKRPKLVIYF